MLKNETRKFLERQIAALEEELGFLKDLLSSVEDATPTILEDAKRLWLKSEMPGFRVGYKAKNRETKWEIVGLTFPTVYDAQKHCERYEKEWQLVIINKDGTEIQAYGCNLSI